METHRDVARRLVRQLGALPTVDASLTRLTAARLRSAKIDLKPLLLRAGLTQEQISDPDNRIAMQSQVAFLNVAAEALDDDTLGLTLATELDCRNVGLLYYVLASSDTLGTALERASRYSRVTNEALALEYRKGREPAQRLSYAGIPRHTARHQIEFFVVAAIRIYRLLTGRQFVPTRVSMVHPGRKAPQRSPAFSGLKSRSAARLTKLSFRPARRSFRWLTVTRV